MYVSDLTAAATVIVAMTAIAMIAPTAAMTASATTIGDIVTEAAAK
jgi:hypothetical protein